MSLYRPSEVRHILDKLHLFPKKRLSQNFLIDGNIVEKVLSLSDISNQDTVLEIGPGLGVMTQAIMAKGAHVIAIEKDARFIPHLRSLGKKLELYEGDFLDFPLDKIEHKKMKVISNLPFKVAAPIIAKLLSHYYMFTSLTIMVQKEVAQRMIAKPRTKDYSSFSVLVQYYSFPKFLFDVSCNCFFPRPQVTSSFIRLDLQKQLSINDHTHFFSFVRACFQKRRKMLSTSLKELYPKNIVQETLQELSLSFQARPEELSVEDFFLLFQKMGKKMDDFRNSSSI